MARVLLVATLAAVATLAGCQPTPDAASGGARPEAAAPPEKAPAITADAAAIDVIPSIEQRVDFNESRKDARALHVRASAGDFGGDPLYDGFELTVQPLDADDATVKKIGSLRVTAYAFNVKTKEGKGAELMSWFVPTAAMMDAWRKIGFDEGYRIRLAWGHRPKATYIVLEVTFRQLDGRTLTVLKSPISIEQTRYRHLVK